MFELCDEQGFTWPVEVWKASRKSPGQKEKQEFEIEFKEISVDELNLIAEKYSGKGIGIGDKAICRAVVVGFKGVIVAGKPLEFSESTLEKLINSPAVANAIASGYLDATNGARKAKN
jgi:hypothetical protein